MSDKMSREITRRELLKRLSLSIAAGSLASCQPGDLVNVDPGGTEIPDAPPPGSWYEGKGIDGAPVSMAQRGAALTAGETRLSQLMNESTGRASPSELLRYLVQQPAFKTVGYSATGEVYAIFTDGRPWVIAVDKRDKPNGAPAAAKGPASARPSVITNPRANRIVTPQLSYEAAIPGKQFRHLCSFVDNPNLLLNSYNTWCRDDEIYMSDISDGSRLMTLFGYEVVEPPGGPGAFHLSRFQCEVPQLKRISGDGVFYWATQGGTYDFGGEVIPILMTTTWGLPEVSEIYNLEFTQQMLVYYTNWLCFTPSSCSSADSGPQTNVAITPKFIRGYQWSFGPYSLAFVNASGSARHEMTEEFLRAGASVYMGWDNVAHVPALCGAAFDFFSLMLGMNENQGQTPASSHRQRPYDWGAVLFRQWALTHAAQYEDADYGLVQLSAIPNFDVPPLFLALRPSMYWNAFDEDESKLHLIGGMFGPPPGGKVVIADNLPLRGAGQGGNNYGKDAEMQITGGTQLSIVDWKSDNIVVNVPKNGPGSAGFVQVQVDGRWSNGAQLTRITFPFTIELRDAGSLRLTVNGEFYFRGDYRGVRIDPDETLNYLPTSKVVGVLKSGTYSASGSYSYTESDVSTQIEWSGGGLLSPNDMPLLVVFNGEMEPELRRGSFRIEASQIPIMEKTTTQPAGSPADVSTAAIKRSVASPPLTPQYPYGLIVEFRDDYFHAQKQWQATVPQGGYNNQNQVHDFTLGFFSAEFPPREDLGGR